MSKDQLIKELEDSIKRSEYLLSRRSNKINRASTLGWKTAMEWALILAKQLD